MQMLVCFSLTPKGKKPSQLPRGGFSQPTVETGAFCGNAARFGTV